MKRIQVLALIVFFTGTVAMYAQSQETRDALQDERIGQVEKALSEHDSEIKALTKSVESLSGSLDRFTGIGIGFGAALTLLQALQLAIAYNARKKSTGAPE